MCGMYEIRFACFLKVWVGFIQVILGPPVPGDMLSGFKKVCGP